METLIDALEADLATSAVSVARRTGGGERWIWLYTDGQSDVPERVQIWAAGCGRPARVEVQEDPLWQDRP